MAVHTAPSHSPDFTVDFEAISGDMPIFGGKTGAHHVRHSTTAGGSRNGDQRMESFKVVKGWIREFVDVAVLFVAVGVMVQILFGNNVPFFNSVTTNLMNFITQLGSNGLVGLIALFVIVWVFQKDKAH
jgi:hypothetical protein